MNSLILTVLSALVLTLIAATVGPAFIDWSAHRATIETYLEEAIGTEVTLSGEADVRLLPTPRVRLSDIAIGAPEAPLLTAEDVELAIELLPLVSGEVRVVRLALGAPVLSARLDEDGALIVPQRLRQAAFTSFFDLDAVVVEDVTVKGGTLAFSDARSGVARRVDTLELSGAARSLRGPFEVRGTGRVAGSPMRLTLAGGALQDDGQMAVAGSLAPIDGTATVRFDGALAASETMPEVSGDLTIASAGPAPFAVRGRLDVDTERALLSGGTLSFGPTLTPVEMSLSALAPLVGEEPIAVSLSARQIDLDTLARNPPDGATVTAPGAEPTATTVPAPQALAKLSEAIAAIAEAWEGVPAGSAEMTVELTVAAILAGGAVIEDVSAAFTLIGADIFLEEAEALLPGDTTVLMNGRTLEDGVVGWLRVEASRPHLLARWWRADNTPQTRLGPVFLEADLAIDDASVTARRASLDLDRSALAGRVRYERAGDRGDPLLALSLDAPRVDVAELARLITLTRQTLGPLSSLAALPAVILDVSADELLLGPITGSFLAIDADYRAGTLTIDALNAEDLAGAMVFAEGQIANFGERPVGTIRGTLDIVDGARSAEALAAILEGGQVTTRALDALPDFTPAALTFSMSGEAGEADGAGADGRSPAPPSLVVNVAGTAGPATLEIALSGLQPGPDWQRAPLTLAASASAEGLGPLLAPIGVDAALGARGVADLQAMITGRAADGFETELSLAWQDEGDELLFASYDGTLAPGDSRGALTIRLSDEDTLAALLPLPDLAPVAVAATLQRNAGGSLSLADIEGTLNGGALAGSLALEDEALVGELEMERLDGDAILALTLGEEALQRGDGALYPQTSFAASALPQRALDLALVADTLELFGTPWREAMLNLRIASGELSVSDFIAEDGSRTLAGDLTLTRTESRASVSGTLALDGATLPPPAPTAAAAIEGTLGLRADGRASGATIAELVASLTGTLDVTVSEGTLSGVPLGPLPLADLAEDGTVTSPAGVEAAANAALDAQTVDFGTLDARFEAAGGTLRLDEASVDGAPWPTLSALALTLPTHQVSAQLEVLPSFTQAFAQDAETPPPPLLARYEGPWRNAAREVDAGALAAWISLRQLAAQIDRVEEENEALEAETEGLPGAAPLPSAEPAAATPPGTDASAPEAEGPPQAPAAAANAEEDEQPSDTIGDLLRQTEPPGSPSEAQGQPPSDTDSAARESERVSEEELPALPGARRAFDMRASDLAPVP